MTRPDAPGGLAQAYWFTWLIAVLATFLWYEILSLVTGNSQNTLSNWIWYHLHIKTSGGIGNWSAADLLTFCAYVSVFVIWLPWHFWFRKFT